MKTKFPILIILMLFGLMTNCNKTDKGLTENTLNLVGHTQIGQGNLYGNGEENIPQQNLVILNSTSWNELIDQMNSVNNVSGSFTEININFSNFIVIAVFDKVYGNGGHSIDITEIIEDETHTFVTVENILNGNATSIMTQPFHIVKIPKNNKTILFQ